MTDLEFVEAAERFTALVDEHEGPCNALWVGLRVPLEPVTLHARRDGWSPERFAGFLDGLGVGLCAAGKDEP